MNYSAGNFDIVIFAYVCVMSLKIVCPQGIIVSPKCIIFRAAISNISALSKKGHPPPLTPERQGQSR